MINAAKLREGILTGNQFSYKQILNLIIMAAYIIVEIEIHDPQMYEEYKKLTPASVAAYNGKFIVRGGNAEHLEGGWHPKRIVVLEFPTEERAKQWWSSAEYAPAKEIRLKAATTRMIVVEGVNS